MALTISVTKKSVTEVMDGMWNITLNMTCLDAGAAEVINQDFTASYKQKTDATALAKQIQQEMQIAINSYKSAKTVYDSAKLTTLVTYLNNKLVG